MHGRNIRQIRAVFIWLSKEIPRLLCDWLKNLSTNQKQDENQSHLATG